MLWKNNVSNGTESYKCVEETHIAECWLIHFIPAHLDVAGVDFTGRDNA